MHIIAPLDKQFPILYVLLKDHIADNLDYKVCFEVLIVFEIFFMYHFGL